MPLQRVHDAGDIGGRHGLFKLEEGGVLGGQFIVIACCHGRGVRIVLRDAFHGQPHIVLGQQGLGNGLCQQDGLLAHRYLHRPALHAGHRHAHHSIAHVGELKGVLERSGGHLQLELTCLGSDRAPMALPQPDAHKRQRFACQLVPHRPLQQHIVLRKGGHAARPQQ